MSRFLESDWHNILSDIFSDEELREVLQLKLFHGYVAYSSTGLPIAFVLIIEESWRGNRVQIHGGCWSGSAWDSYEAFISMIDRLFTEGKAVRSQCKVENVRTIRFLRSVGFVNHYSTEQYRYFWLPYKRFVNSKIYKRS